MDSSVEIIRRLDRIEQRLSQMTMPRMPDLSVAAFAKMAGLSRNTVFKRIADGTIAKRNGRVPVSELRKFAS